MKKRHAQEQADALKAGAHKTESDADRAARIKIAQIGAKGRPGARGAPQAKETPEQRRIRDKLKAIDTQIIAISAGFDSKSSKAKQIAALEEKQGKLNTEFSNAGLDAPRSSGKTTPPPASGAKTFDQFLNDFKAKNPKLDTKDPKKMELLKKIYQKNHAAVMSQGNRSIAGYAPGNTPIYREEQRPSRYMQDQGASAPQAFVPLADRRWNLQSSPEQIRAQRMQLEKDRAYDGLVRQRQWNAPGQEPVPLESPRQYDPRTGRPLPYRD